MQRKHYEKETKARDASHLSVGIVVSRFNEDATKGLLKGALATLAEWKVKRGNITTLYVPGSFEIPYGCQKLMNSKRFDAIIALGCILKGETKHDEYIANAVSYGIMRLSLDYKIPIAFGVLTPNTLEQAKARSSGKFNKGREAALAALETALLR
jgi:6,7-dimethyl-8-ribityllumazine synthase